LQIHSGGDSDLAAEAVGGFTDSLHHAASPYDQRSADATPPLAMAGCAEFCADIAFEPDVSANTSRPPRRSATVDEFTMQHPLAHRRAPNTTISQSKLRVFRQIISMAANARPLDRMVSAAARKASHRLGL